MPAIARHFDVHVDAFIEENKLNVMKRTIALVGLLLVFTPDAAHAAEFWVDPVDGKSGNDGSSSAPWRSLQEVLDMGLVATQAWESLPYEEGAKLVTKNPSARVKGGDTIYLRSGYHGALRVLGFYNTKTITVAAEEGHEPRFEGVLVRASSHWRFRGLHVSPEHAPKYERTTLFDIDSHGWHGPVHDIVVEGSRLQSVEDSSKWSASDWETLACHGIEADGKNVMIRNNVVKNVYHGIHMDAESSLVEGNLVENFAGDGIRGNGDYTVFEYNTVKNCYHVNDEHNDGFQSWSQGSGGVGTGEVIGVVLRGNTFINYEDPEQPYRAMMQGIGCFDGMYIDWVVENNVIITDHWHGITFAGLRNSRIVNNTVIDPNRERPGPPWIMVGPHKNGTPSAGVVVRNNLATAIDIKGGQDVIADHNLIINQPAKLFVDAPAYDLRLRKTARAVDTGSSNLAPDVDHDKVSRPWGDGYDIGAYEYHEGEVGVNLQDRSESETTADSKVDEDPSAAQPQQVSEDLAIQRTAETETEQQSRTQQRADSFWSSNTRAWLLALVALSLLAAVWLVRRQNSGT